MKRLLFSILAISYAMPMFVLAHNATPKQSLEVQVQSLPANRAEGYYDNTQNQDDDEDVSPNNWQNNRSIPAGVKNQTSDHSGNNGVGNRSNQPIEQSERTLSIIKPDAVKNNHIGDIISRFEKNGLRIAAIKMVKLNRDQAAQFYQVHRDRPFFADLVDFMASGPVVVLVLEGNQAVAKNRQLMGATDPSKAEKGTLRADFAESMSKNAVHGSDSLESAKEEILFFFKPNDIQQRF